MNPLTTVSGWLQIMLGDMDIVVTGGVEVMSRTPYTLNQARWGARLQHGVMTDGLWDALTPRMVRGENAGQTYQFVASGSAELGFVARSQITRPKTPISGSFWAVPEALYDPIEQQAVQLSERPSVRRFMEFVRSAAGSAVIESYGYRLPAPVENDGGG